MPNSNDYDAPELLTILGRMEGAMLQVIQQDADPKVRRILIVDDNRAIHEDIRKSLARDPTRANGQ